MIAVLERPSIESFTITGNKDIKTEDLEKSLRNVGLARGKTFNQSTLDEVERFLTDQYFSRGKYAVKVDTKVEEVAGNRVKIAVDVAEGKRSKIRQINVVGNEAFSDEELLEEFKLRTPNWLSWYRQDDRYSREELSGDIEKLRSHYMDRGYANMDVESTQVAISARQGRHLHHAERARKARSTASPTSRSPATSSCRRRELRGLLLVRTRRHLLAQADHARPPN